MSDYKLLYNNSTGQVYLKRIPVNVEWFSPPYLVQKPATKFVPKKNPFNMPTQISKSERESTIQSFNNKIASNDIDSKIEDLVSLALPNQTQTISSESKNNNLSEPVENIIELDAKAFFEKYPKTQEMFGIKNQQPTTVKKVPTFDPSKYFPKEKPIVVQPQKPIVPDPNHTSIKKEESKEPKKEDIQAPIILPNENRLKKNPIKSLFDSEEKLCDLNEPTDFYKPIETVIEKSIQPEKNIVIKSFNLEKQIVVPEKVIQSQSENVFIQNQSEKIVHNSSEKIVHNSSKNSVCSQSEICSKHDNETIKVIQGLQGERGPPGVCKCISDNVIYNIPIRKGTCGLKKVMFSDLNQQGFSKMSPHFNIGLNRKSVSRELLKKPVFDSFYLTPGTMEVKNKYEINIVNEKRVEVFRNKEKSKDVQHFPMDYIPNGIMFPLRNANSSYDKISIKQVYWSIYQNLDVLASIGQLNTSEVGSSNSIYGLVPDGEEFLLKNIMLQLHIEIHAPLQPFADKKYFADYDLYPYEELIFRKDGQENDSIGSAATTCIFPVKTFDIKSINDGLYFPIDFNLPPDFATASGLACAMICFRISVHPDSFEQLRVRKDKTVGNKGEVFGVVPFSQIIVDCEFNSE